MVKTCVVALGISLGMIGLFSSAHADVISLRQELLVPEGAGGVEITTYFAENEQDRQKIVAQIRSILAADRKTNPELLTHFEEIYEAGNRQPNSVDEKTPDAQVGETIRELAETNPVVRSTIPAETSSTLRRQFSNFFKRNYRMTFALVRGGLNTTVMTVNLMVTNQMPFHLALAAGGLMGSLSGGMQYWNEDLQKFLNKSVLGAGEPANLLKKGIKKIEPYFRWGALEFGFVSALQLTLSSMGYGPVGTTMELALGNLAATGAGLFAQGTWEVGLSKKTRDGIAAARSAIEKLRVQMRADLYTLALSAISVSAMAAKISGVPAADAVFGVMGGTGLIYLVKVYFDDWRCRKLLKKREPPRSDEQTNDDVASWVLNRRHPLAA